MQRAAKTIDQHALPAVRSIAARLMGDADPLQNHPYPAMTHSYLLLSVAINLRHHGPEGMSQCLRELSKYKSAADQRIDDTFAVDLWALSSVLRVQTEELDDADEIFLGRTIGPLTPSCLRLAAPWIDEKGWRRSSVRLRPVFHLLRSGYLLWKKTDSHD